LLTNIKHKRILSVPVQLIAWEDSSPKWPIMCRVGR